MNKKKLCIIIQARTGSTRLPHKMLMHFYREKTILDLLLIRIKDNLRINLPIIVATSDNEQDLEIVKIAKRNDVYVFQGNENDVLDRFIEAAKSVEADSCIRICADNPFLSMAFLNQLLEYVENNECDYASFMTDNGIPSIKTHYGLWTEFITLNALKRISHMTDEKLYHEHVTNYAYEHRDLFRCVFLPIENDILKYEFRLTVDTIEDFENARKIYEQLIVNKKAIEYNNIISLISKETLENMKLQIMNNSK